MKLQTLTVGPLATNGFFLQEGNTAVIVDPGDEPARFEQALKASGAELAAILITHGHADHIGAVAALREAHPEASVLCHELDAEMLTEPTQNLSALMGQPLDAGPATGTMEDGQRLEFGALVLEVRHVPGHTAGHVVLLHEQGDLIAGDTLFAGGVGRWDLPGGDGERLFREIRARILSLPDETRVHPGHGPATTVGVERRENPFVGEHAHPGEFF